MNARSLIKNLLTQREFQEENQRFMTEASKVEPGMRLESQKIEVLMKVS